MVRDVHQAVRETCLWLPEAEEFVAHGSPNFRVRGKTPVLEAPSKTLSASQIDPLKSPRASAVLKSFRKLCLRLPESHEESQFGHPVWRAGKKSFALARPDGRRLTLCFLVEVEISIFIKYYSANLESISHLKFIMQFGFAALAPMLHDCLDQTEAFRTSV